jgi:hypothetical protein
MNNFYSPGQPRLGLRREPGIVLLLHVITCGIYYLWWIYTVSEEMMAFDLDPDTSPGLEVLFSVISCGTYTIYWDYKTAKKIRKLQDKVGLTANDNSVLFLVLNFLGLGLIPSMIEQGDLNNIWNRAEQNMASFGSYYATGA